MQTFHFSLAGCDRQFDLKPFRPDLRSKGELCTEQLMTFTNFVQVIELTIENQTNFHLNNKYSFAIDENSFVLVKLTVQLEPAERSCRRHNFVLKSI